MIEALAERDESFDGVFYYGVVTTGIYCRPSCAARLPRPENVRFFDSHEAAAAAGFRPCKRCRPDGVDKDVDMLVATARFIDAHADEKLTLASLSRQAGLSPSRLQKRFKSAFGISPKQYQDAARMGRLRDALKHGDKVTGAIFSAGYGSISRVYGEAARDLGMTPSAYRAGGEGELIHYACRETALGPLMMAATCRGVCFAQFGDDEPALLEQLRTEFPRATLESSPATKGPDLDAWVGALDAYLDRNAPRPDLPLDLKGTAYQLKVWSCLLRIDEGDVVSYAELAKAAGRPRAVRAAAGACAANRVGVLVPCHRVLRGDGKIGGYRWGVDRKRTLLDLERHNRAAGQ
jgi:AraC family transcriptional regulator of adaptative response/methylated-DNA-[protein]-cysteine methyltransferase